MKSLLFFCLISAATELPGQNSEIPKWVLVDWEYHASGSGTWLADNSAFKNTGEPFEQYGTQWTFCPGKQCLRGRLFGKIGGQEVAAFWEFFCFWDAVKGKIRIIQIGGNGTVGEGWIWQEQDGSTKSEQRFSNSDGSFSDSGHQAIFNGENEITTRSFDISGEKWIARREYIWTKIKQ